MLNIKKYKEDLYYVKSEIFSVWLIKIINIKKF